MQAYPSGLPAFTARLHNQSLKYGIYGAASGVTCGTNPGQLYNEDRDARWYAAQGVDYLKSDNCARWALTSLRSPLGRLLAFSAGPPSPGLGLVAPAAWTRRQLINGPDAPSYALDSSVRFGAMADALNRTGKGIVLSIEPFAITPDPEQSLRVSNLARVFMDIRGDEVTFLDRADHSDKWSPLAGPGYW